MTPQYWLIKQEPEAYAWSQLIDDGQTAWTGIRNFQARNYLRAMRPGDLAAYYHSVSEKQVVGIARILRSAYPDPTADEGDWSCVDLEPFQSLKRPVSLAALKGDAAFADLPLLRQSRLSVMPLSKAHFHRLLELGETDLKPAI